jgi:predicted ATPase/DNA-binding winged helix-turn-helix (wHTH) protein
VYESGDWAIDLGKRELRARGVSVPIGSRAFELIEVLVRSTGGIVTKDDLMRQVWPGAFVGENTLQVHISALRKALGPDRGMLRTLFGRGYCLAGSWTPRQDSPVPPDASGAATPPTAQSYANNLPATTSGLIGRESAIQDLTDLLSAYRAVSLTGPGGIGKTALALQVARDVFPNLAGEAWFVELASLSDPHLVPSGVASALGIKLGGSAISADSVAKAIEARKLLLILDNCEHVIDAAAQLAETVIRVCPRASVLATSREVLRIEGEYAYRVPPLDLPSPQQVAAGDVHEHGAVQLFIVRTRALQADFALHRENLAQIAAICRRLDGIPLAIEFAAARAASLGLHEVAARLNESFELLAGGRRTALPRHQTLRATLDWSYQLLPPLEQRLLRHLAVFAGGFTLEAAAAVMDGGGKAELSVIEGIASLVTKSFVMMDGSASVDRWRLLETIRAYAFHMLAEAGENAEAARRHAAFFRDLFQAEAQAAQSQAAPANMPRHEREIDNVRAALDWSLAPSGDLSLGLELTAASAPLWFHLSLMAEYRERAERALECLQATPKRDAALEMRLQAALGHALWYSANDPDRMERAFAHALALAEQIDNATVQLQGLWGLWAVRRGRGEYGAALALATRYGDIAAQSGDRRFTSLADRILGLTHHYLGNQEVARGLMERVRSEGKRTGQASADFQLGPEVAATTLLARIRWLQGFPDEALATAQQAIDAAHGENHWFSVCYVIYIAGCPLSLWVGNLAEAQRRLAILVERGAGNAYVESWVRCFALTLRLRQGSERESLIASFIEPRMDVSTVTWLASLGSAPEIPMPLPGTEPEDALWSLPEVLRVDAELLLWHRAADADAEAETRLRRSLALARQQAVPSWELRTAMSLARLWRRCGKAAEARALLAGTYDRFTEGFGTGDLVAARKLLAAWA